MSYLLFMDESGHDHKNLPYEVRGGVSIASVNFFNIIKELQYEEERIFGCKLSEYKTEIKGSKLLEKMRFKWAVQGEKLSAEERQKGCRRFLTACLEHRAPCQQDFTAYGQASLMMANTIFRLLKKYKAKIFACVIEKGVQKPKNFKYEEYLLKDHIGLMETFACFLARQHEDGLLIMDQSEKENDKKFKRQLANYFSKTLSGQQHANWIIPEPLFIESDTNYLIQVADFCIYAINVGYRKLHNSNIETRHEVQELCEDKIDKLQYKGTHLKTINNKTQRVKLFGIKIYKNPYKK